MRAVPIVLAALVLCASVGLSQKKSDVSLADLKAGRVEDKLNIDGRVEITSPKPVKGLVVFFDFLSADKEVIATEKAPVTEETLRPGKDQAFHVDCHFPPGAVRFRVRAFDVNEKELRVQNPGPFVIE